MQIYQTNRLQSGYRPGRPIATARQAYPAALAPQRGNTSDTVRFGGLCPICLTLMAGGIGAGLAVLRSRSAQKGNQYSLENLYGKDLAKELLAKLEGLEKTSPGTIERFAKNPEAGSTDIMKALGESLSLRLKAALDAKRKKP